MDKIIVINNRDELDAAAKNLLEFCRNEKKFAFYGEMGSGKTTFIKAICKNLGIKNNMSSPTFSIINEYHNSQKIYHFDFYRLKNVKEAIDIGVEEYFAGKDYCFIEWPEIAESILPENTVKIKIEAGKNQERTIRISRF